MLIKTEYYNSDRREIDNIKNYFNNEINLNNKNIDLEGLTSNIDLSNTYLENNLNFDEYFNLNQLEVKDLDCINFESTKANFNINETITPFNSKTAPFLFFSEYQGQSETNENSNKDSNMNKDQKILENKSNLNKEEDFFEVINKKKKRLVNKEQPNVINSKIISNDKLKTKIKTENQRQKSIIKEEMLIKKSDGKSGDKLINNKKNALNKLKNDDKNIELISLENIRDTNSNKIIMNDEKLNDEEEKNINKNIYINKKLLKFEAIRENLVESISSEVKTHLDVLINSKLESFQEKLGTKMEKSVDIIKKQTEELINIQEKNKELMTKINNLVSQNLQSRHIFQQQQLNQINLMKNINAYNFMNIHKIGIGSNPNLNVFPRNNPIFLQMMNRNMLHYQNKSFSENKNFKSKILFYNY